MLNMFAWKMTIDDDDDDDWTIIKIFADWFSSIG